LRFLYPANRKVLAYLREHEGEEILCVANVSRAPQAVQLDLGEFKGRVPMEMTGGTDFPPIGELPYLLTLPAYGFYWFQLSEAAKVASWVAPMTAPELFTLVLTGPLESLLTGRERHAFENTIAPRFIASRRWFGDKEKAITGIHILDVATLQNPSGQEAFLLPRIAVDFAGAERQEYFVPFAVEEGREDEALMPFAVARVRRGSNVGLMYGAPSSPDFGVAVVECMKRRAEVRTSDGVIRFQATQELESDSEIDPADVRRLGAEQSNTSIAFGSRMILKLYRRLQPGIHPELEVARFLTETAGFENTPALLGSVEHVAPDGTPRALAVLQRFVRNQGDAWSFTLDALRRELDTLLLLPENDAPPLEDAFASYLPYASILGRRTAELHRAFATPTNDPAFSIEALGADDVRAVADDARAWAERAFTAIKRLGAGLGNGAGDAIEALASRREACLALIDALGQEPAGGIKSRVHGDYHLGQVLIVQDDLMIVDFEGEPSRPADARRGKSSPLRDVAGMLRSFAYAAETAARDMSNRFAEAAPRAAAATARWRALTETAFLTSYKETAQGSPVWLEDDAARGRLLRLHLLAKAFYEIAYEANNRPDWIETPVRGVLSILDQKG
jgi:maltose alpha-D-glucosyltransferase/alpha-amylase